MSEIEKCCESSSYCKIRFVKSIGVPDWYPLNKQDAQVGERGQDH